MSGFLTLTRDTDGQPVRVRAASIDAYWTIGPNKNQPVVATVVHLAGGLYSEHVRETPDELGLLIDAAHRADMVAMAEIEQEVWSADVPELPAVDDQDAAP